MFKRLKEIIEAESMTYADASNAAGTIAVEAQTRQAINKAKMEAIQALWPKLENELAKINGKTNDFSGAKQSPKGEPKRVKNVTPKKKAAKKK